MNPSSHVARSREWTLTQSGQRSEEWDVLCETVYKKAKDGLGGAFLLLRRQAADREEDGAEEGEHATSELLPSRMMG